MSITQQPDSQHKGGKPISYKVCQYHTFAVTKNLLRSACYFDKCNLLKVVSSDCNFSDPVKFSK